MDSREWLTRYLKLQATLDIELEKILELAVKDIDKTLKGKTGAIEKLQILQTKKEILKILAKLWFDTGRFIRSGMARAAILAIDVGFDWDTILIQHAFVKKDRDIIKLHLESNAIHNLDVLNSRRKISLSSQVYKTRAFTANQLDRKINSALARGLTWRQFAKEVIDFVDPKTPGGASYAAKRLARTEINNAYHGISIASNANKPWNRGMIWALSKSHERKDICNELVGIYPLHKVPLKPHPHCFCYIYPDVISEAEFVVNLSAGLYRDYLSKHYRADRIAA